MMSIQSQLTSRVSQALSASVNAACMALLDAGIQMKTTFAAITCCITPTGSVLIDPTEAEIQVCVKEYAVLFIQIELVTLL